LTEHYVDRASPDTLRLYLAHLIVRQLDWSIRHHERAAIDHWLRISRMVARELLDFRSPGLADVE
jgi:hypothetical protein